MIIWGSRARDTQSGTGNFYCPKCRRDTGYSLRKVSRWFTLYFIPIFPMEKLGEYIKCSTCSGDFRPEITQLSPAQIEAAISPWTCTTCGNRNPPGQESCLGCSASRQLAAPEPPPSSPPPLPSTGVS